MNVQVAMRPEAILSFRTPNGRTAQMTIREGTNDWNTLNACMTEDEYHLAGLELSGWAFDIGGYLGGVGIGLALDHKDLRVIIVEPVPDNARLIRENVARNLLDDRVTIIENAVGGPDTGSVAVWFNYRGTETLEHHAFVGNSSIAYDHGGEPEHDEVIYDQPETISSLISGRMDVPPDLIKIDCEGGEWEILTDRAVWGCPLIIGEAHSVRGHKGRDIIDLLSATHDVTIQGVPEDPKGNGTVEFMAVRR